MAVANRAKRLHALARELTKQLDLPLGAVEAELDEYRRPAQWYLKWTDGPTVALLTAAAKKIDAEVLAEATPVRTLSDFTWAVATIRLTMTSDPLPPMQGYYPNSMHVREWLEKRNAPRPLNKRERVMADRLVALTSDSTSYKPEYLLIAEFVQDNGVACLLKGDSAGDTPLTPVETLTAHYAAAGAREAWTRRLIPMDPLAAFLAVQADPEPGPALAAAALALVPEVHRGVDAAAGRLLARTQEEPAAAEAGP
ncbi:MULTISPECIES: hypothetical protein [unclassified Streptomyces]|uniref:hypothetical protein n=1 Tax=unclassified Streptomyces TaxID=2593676 RepID=UPI0035E311C5